MSYSKALEAAGARILAEERFGSYQGDWWCLCEYQGNVGWVTASFGSCSGCDAYEHEFRDIGWEDEIPLDRLRDFGFPYLETMYSQEEALKIAAENLDWDGDAKDMVEFIEKEWKKHKRTT